MADSAAATAGPSMPSFALICSTYRYRLRMTYRLMQARHNMALPVYWPLYTSHFCKQSHVNEDQLPPKKRQVQYSNQEPQVLSGKLEAQRAPIIQVLGVSAEHTMALSVNCLGRLQAAESCIAKEEQKLSRPKCWGASSIVHCKRCLLLVQEHWYRYDPYLTGAGRGTGSDSRLQLRPGRTSRRNPPMIGLLRVKLTNECIKSVISYYKCLLWESS